MMAVFNTPKIEEKETQNIKKLLIITPDGMASFSI
jgi:hypothetical protein